MDVFAWYLVQVHTDLTSLSENRMNVQCESSHNLAHRVPKDSTHANNSLWRSHIPILAALFVYQHSMLCLYTAHARRYRHVYTCVTPSKARPIVALKAGSSFQGKKLSALSGTGTRALWLTWPAL